MTLFNVSTRTTLVFIVAVPNYLSPEKFIAFCGSHVEYFSDLCFISYNGKRFSLPETEVCHIYLAQLVEYLDSAKIASIPQPGYTKLPTCPICLERLDHDTSSINITVCDHSFQCSCITKWPFWSCQLKVSVVKKRMMKLVGALFSSNVDTIVDEYNFLLATQMETQRQHYELLLVDAKSRKEILIREVIGKAEAEKTQEIQSKLEEVTKETKAVSHVSL
ncbi:hypothetical protein L2E82_08245 [Cichorium intybus]|uniref:Uncharacterized protein n=1 Tax=Cichorium intybus TaxID=13427 RepID=A0ACB9G6N0_CICIN|nr:hypothetical protein L2E82_08245 [Cichorium intybus]